MLTSNPSGKILLVDDDKNITDLLSFNLSSEGYSVSVAPIAKDVNIQSIADTRLIIVDAMSQPYSGIDLISEIKSHPLTENIPIIFCTDPQDVDVVVSAFEAGAEDSVNKPFSLRELMARIKAVLRRHPVKAAATSVQADIQFPEMGLKIYPDTQKVEVLGDMLHLTKTEYSILLFLVQNRNSFFTRPDICQEVWDNDDNENVRKVDTNISRLRKKMGESGKYIINRYGMGYAFVDKIAH